jgi:hypothetical protein
LRLNTPNNKRMLRVGCAGYGFVDAFGKTSSPPPC